jgi:DivIVA domain-containing protein
MPLTPEDVQNKRFTVVRFKTGYDEEEVDNFLDEVEEEIRRLVTTNKSLNNAALRAPETLSPAALLPPVARAEPVAPVAPPLPPMPELVLDDNGDPALRTLMMAQRTAEEAISKAHADASEILNAARAKATALEKDLRIAHAGRLAALEQERTGLIEEIAALRGFEREFRTRLRSYLSSSMSDLDARPSVEPAPKQAAPVVPAGTVPATGRHAAERPTGELPPAAAPPPPAAAPAPPAAVPPAAVPPRPATQAPVAPPAPAPPVAPPAAPAPFSPAPPATPGFVSQPVPPPSGPPTQA